MGNKTSSAKQKPKPPKPQKIRDLVIEYFQIVCILGNLFLGSMGYTVVPVIGLGLFFTQLWFVPLAYLTWMLLDMKTPFKGGRKLKWFRRLFIFKHCRDYFPCELVKTVDLPPTSNYLFVIYPHGVCTYNLLINFGTEANNVESLVFPGLDFSLFGVNFHFFGPLSREYFLSLGAVSISEESMLYVLDDSRTGKVGVMAAGGFAELQLTKPSNECRIVAKDRKGYVRVALKSGCSLVPVFSFGENCTYELYEPEWPIINRIRNLFSRFTRVYIAYPKSELIPKLVPNFVPDRLKELSHYIPDFLPKRVKITTVVGKPIPLPKVAEPSNELIDEYHAKYLEQLQKLFEKYKHKYDPSGEDARLIIV